MTRTRIPLVVAVVALLLAGCGQSEPSKGGTLRVLAASDFQQIDPGQVYYQFDYMAILATQRPLYSYKPAQLEAPTADLAESSPHVSPDGKSVTVKIKSGVRYSPPVNREVTAADVKYAIERGVPANVANPYVRTYFADLEGFKDFEAGKRSDIAGIRIPDEHTLVFELSQPTGVIAAAGALAMPLTAPVPREYARRFDAKSSSTYGQHQVATGPYMFQVDRGGTVTGYDPGRRAVLVRNPNWNADTDYRPAYVDRIEFDLGNDVTVASRKILGGRNMVSGDFTPPPAVIKETLRSRKDQLTFTPGGSIDFMSLNTTKAPLDDVNVRRAIVAGMDRDAMRLTQGGSVTGDVASHFIPPGVPGFEQAGGYTSALDFLRDPRGSPALAASYLKRAGYGEGRYDGKARLLMVGSRDAPADKAAEVAASHLEKLGFKVDLRLLSTDTMYTKFCSVPKADVASCPNLGWGRDFNDPQPFLDAPFNGTNIAPAGNTNWSQLDDPKVNAAIAQGRRLVDPETRIDHWATVDRRVMGLAPVVPWLWRKQPTIRSENVRGVMNRFLVAWDLSFSRLK